RSSSPRVAQRSVSRWCSPVWDRCSPRPSCCSPRRRTRRAPPSSRDCSRSSRSCSSWRAWRCSVAGVWWRRLGVLLAALVVSVASGCAGDSAGAAEIRSGLVDIGNGRKLFLDCQGHGSPTVFIIPGLGSYAEAWNVVVPPNDPIRSSPYDIIGEAKLTPSPDAVQPTVARTTRVCSYDRPGTRFDGADRSTPVAQPHTIAQDV